MDLNVVEINNLEVLNDGKEYAIKLINQKEKKKPKETEEEYKHQLIRHVVQIMGTQKNKYKPPRLKNMLLGHHYKMWSEIRSTIIKKVIGSMMANDLLQNLSTSMQLTATEWMLFDLILVHEDIEFVNFNNLDTTCLRELFELVKEYRVEILTGKELAEAWIHLTLQYNSSDRQCSPMLLQQRWYHLKMLSRAQVYKPNKLLNTKKRNMLIEIATKYQKIITQKWSTWSALVQQKNVILPEEFIMVLKEKRNWKGVEAREGWYLHVKEVISNPKTKEPEIIEIESDDDINEILRQKAENLANISQEKVNDIIEICPRQLVCGDIAKNSPCEKSNKCKDADQSMREHVIDTSITNNAPILCDSDDEMDQLLQEKAYLLSMELANNLKTLENIIEDQVDKINKDKNSEDGMCEVENGIINKEVVMTDNQYERLNDIDLSDKDIEFLDDGIEVDENTEYNKKTIESRTVSSSVIDRKLIMKTIVYLKRIDSMEVFKFLDYESVKDKRVIESVELENKLVAKHVSKGKDINSFRDQAILGYNKVSITSNDNIRKTPPPNTRNRIKYTSWLLQKPKKRQYKSEQLLKNPDFNSQLKNIPQGFLSSMRNRVLIKECRPLTIDLHKAFENKLINGTMFLERSGFRSCKDIEIINNDNNKETTILSSMSHVLKEDQHMQLAEHVRNLIATITTDKHEKGDLQMSTVAPELSLKRNKVINLPDKDEIRLVNKRLLTAEITPRHQSLLNMPTVSCIKSDESSKQPKIINDSSEEPRTIVRIVRQKICKESGKPPKINVSSKEPPTKRLKMGTENSRPPKIIMSCSKNTTFYCCWAREKIVSIKQNLDSFCKKHMCLKNCCTCCCRPYLDILLSYKSTIQQNVKDTSLNTPKSSSMVVRNISSQNNKKLIINTYNTKAGYVKIGGHDIIDTVQNSNLDNVPNKCKSKLLNYTLDLTLCP